MLLDIFIYSAVFYIGTEMTASALKKFKARRAAKALQVRHSVTHATTRHVSRHDTQGFPCCSLV